MFIITIVLFTEQSLTTYAGDYGELFGGSSNGPVEIHRKDGSWVGVRFLPEKALEYSPDAIKVAVIDSGVFFGHPQLSGLIIDSKDFSGEGIEDKVGHGTIDAILTTAAQRLLEPAAKKSKVALLIAKVTKTVNGKAKPQRSAVIAAINWAASRNASMVNLSLGFQDEASDNKELCDTIKKYNEILFVAAAGNSGPQIQSFPAACELPNILSVGVAKAWSGVGDTTAPGDVELGLIAP